MVREYLPLAFGIGALLAGGIAYGAMLYGYSFSADVQEKSLDIDQGFINAFRPRGFEKLSLKAWDNYVKKL